MKKDNKTIVIFLVLMLVVLFSGVSISLFLLSQETNTRQEVESTLVELRSSSLKMQTVLKEAQKQIEVLKGKNKDADEKINSLLEEIDLEEALREEIKAENKKFKDALEAEAQAKLDMRKKLTAELEIFQTNLKEAESKVATHDQIVADLQKKLEAAKNSTVDLEKALESKEELAKELEAKKTELLKLREQAGLDLRRIDEKEILPASNAQEKVDLDRIIVTPQDAQEGRVLNVDVETEFLIFDLGSKQGITSGQIMSVYRGKAYLGDIRVSRVQEEMAAADFIPPFSSRKVRKNDQVVVKR